MELLGHYVSHLTDKGTDLTEEALDLAKHLAAECPDSFITLSALEGMARIYIQSGKYEKAKEIIESMPYRYHLDICDKMRTTARCLNSEDSIHETREWKRWAHQELYLVCRDEARCFFDIGDYENALYSYEEAVDVLERFWRREIPDEYALLQDPYISKGITIVSIAACLYKLGRIGECDEALDKAYHLIRDCFSDAQWEKWKYLRMGEYRRVYEQMGLNEYKPCAY
ncbi:MAG: tetratricopeptide repeat protein [Oscillospiraceae bacterium]|nr:tetratricopeptide repeat protein [Oscillospiraceae bacterium]